MGWFQLQRYLLIRFICRIPHQIPVLCGTDSHAGLKQLVEIGIVAETAGFAYFVHTASRINHLLGFHKAHIDDVLMHGDIHVLLKGVGQMVFADVQGIGDGFQCNWARQFFGNRCNGGRNQRVVQHPRLCLSRKTGGAVVVGIENGLPQKILNGGFPAKSGFGLQDLQLLYGGADQPVFVGITGDQIVAVQRFPALRTSLK